MYRKEWLTISELLPQEYENKIIDDYVEFYIYKRNGEKYTCYVDLADWDKVKSHPYRWHVSKHGVNTYVSSTIYTGIVGECGVGKIILLHRFLLDYDNKHRADHINHDGLDNRRNNLRIVDTYKNNMNRQCRNSNNNSGYRNVFWNKWHQRWTVTLSNQYKRIYIGEYVELQDAVEAAKEAREKYYGKFAGADFWII